MSGAFDGSDGQPAAGDGGSGAGEIMLFGVRLVVDSMRKSVSLNNLSQYVHPQDLNSVTGGSAGGGGGAPGDKEKEEPSAAMAPPIACYASSDDVVLNSASSTRERKRGVPWTEDEHRLFLLGLERVGKGDWRGISRNFVKTRTPTQVASHAQKYFLRRTNLNRRRRRSSLFDITTDTVTANQSDKAPASGNAAPVPVILPLSLENPVGDFAVKRPVLVDEPSLNLVRPASAAPAHQPTILGSDLSLSLKTSGEKAPSLSPMQRDSVYLTMSSFSNGESIISVA